MNTHEKYPDTVIFSMRDNTSPMVVNQLVNIVTHLGFKLIPCVGMYRGTVEPSWIVSTECMQAIREHYSPFWKEQIYSEESVLFVDGESRAAYQYFSRSRRIIHLGNMVCVSREKAIANGAFTQRLDNLNCFIAQKE